MFLPKGLARAQAQISRTVILKNVGAVMSVVDPITGQTGIVTSQNFWSEPFRPLITANRGVLTRFVVLNKEAVLDDQKVGQRISNKKKSRRAELTVMREADMGVSDEQFTVRTHLGYLCRAGDVVLGYHLGDTNLVDEEATALLNNSVGAVPEVVIVRKLYGSAATGENDPAKKRTWKLQRLDVETTDNYSRKEKKKDGEKMEEDEEDFLTELEANRDMRERVNLYRSMKKKVTYEDDGGNPRDVAMDGGEGEGGGGETFEAAAVFEGPRRGRAFKLGSKGLGYYSQKVAVEDPEDGEEEVDEADDQHLKIDELLDGLGLEPKPVERMPVAGVDYEYDENKMWGGAPIGQSFVEEGQKAKTDGINYIDRDEAKTVQEKTTAETVEQFGTQFLSKGFKFT